MEHNPLRDRDDALLGFVQGGELDPHGFVRVRHCGGQLGILDGCLRQAIGTAASRSSHELCRSCEPIYLALMTVMKSCD